MDRSLSLKRHLKIVLVEVLDVIWTGLTFLLTVYQIPKIIGGIMVITLILVKGAPKKGLLIQRSKKVAFVLYFSIIFFSTFTGKTSRVL